MKQLNPIFLALITTTNLIYSLVVFSQESSVASNSIEVSERLQLGPFQTALPVFDDGSVNLNDLLVFQEMDVSNWWPSEKESVNLNKNEKLLWKKGISGSGGIRLGKSNDPQIVYLASYLSADRFVKADLKVTSPHLFQVYLDGAVIKTKSSSEKPDDRDESKSEIQETIKLETGKHLLLIKALSDPENKSDWNIKASLEVSAEYGGAPISISTSPAKIMTIQRLLDGTKVKGVSISPDGEFMTISYSRTQPPTNQIENWIVIHRTKDNSVILTLRGGLKVSNAKWSYQKGVFAYTRTDGDNTDLWIVNLLNGRSFAVLEGIKNLDDYSWSPDGTFIIYSVTEKAENKNQKVKRWKSLKDRMPDWRDRSFLYRVSVPGGTAQRLTAGEFTTHLLDISSDGRQLLISQYTDDDKERPYTQDHLFVLDLESVDIDTLWEGYWFNSGQWSPDGRMLLLLGGPSMFGEVGRNVSDGKTPNERDIQAYLYEISNNKVSPLTRNFNPAIEKAIWPQKGQFIYFNAKDKLEQNLYRYDLSSQKFEKFEIGIESLKDISIADEQPIGVYFGSSAAVPPKAYKINLATKKFELISNPGERDYENVIFGRVEPWNYKSFDGTDIQGTIYYPPYFDPEKSYPCIVYYYGGVNPIPRTFGGRYPKNLFAAQGYVVYTMTPGGAVGFGQEFSAAHSNDWGKIVSGQIIEGAKKFLKAHPFVDSTRVGCIGASYGGFMTMLLLTQTDMFAAGISHAGISSISSYWGEGYWGYWYNSISAPNSFPWNRQDIYVGQSVLFSADKINTPVLLLHGDADTNVPPGESTQLFTALKLLGKEVEYVQVPDQNHWILNYSKRIVWENTILAWFDKWLKNQPQWWEDLYGEK